MSKLKELKNYKCFEGRQLVYRHESRATKTPMEFSVYIPPQLESGVKLPVLYWLSGLTCTWENFTAKAGAQRYAAEHGLILIAPDTSPRGLELPGEHDTYDFGSGAGFYVDATQKPWADHYNMYSYVTAELPALIEDNFPVDSKRTGICGHSMGGHGALVCALRNPQQYQSVSAFAPIVNPCDVPWGHNAFSGYLGDHKEEWEQYDASCLVAHGEWDKPILIDQGNEDEFLGEELQPDVFRHACQKAQIDLTLRMQDGYDHSYYTIATFIGDHIEWHAAELKK